MVARDGGLKEAVERKGFAILDTFVPSGVIEALLSALEHELGSDRAGTRQLHQRLPAVAALVRSAEIGALIKEAMPGGFPVRSILFDKTPETNWHVPWHQDLSICVKERRDVPGFTAWSVKEGVHHVRPPASLTEKMLTIRLHLDNCGEDNGPLRVIPGSHRHGRLTSDQIAAWRTTGPIATCLVPRGGAVIMKPLLLHSSFPARTPSHRRVLHFEFASEPLPQPLEWIS